MPADTDTAGGAYATPAAENSAPEGRRCFCPDDCELVFAGTAERYRGCGRLVHGYVCSKLRRDPVHRDVLSLAAAECFGDMVDIGCGRGQLGVALLLAGLAKSVLGVDCLAGCLAQADQAAAGLAYRSMLVDLADGFEPPAADTILAVDVLYQLDDASQQRLLRSVAQAARRRAILRLLDPRLGMRSAATVGLERLWRGISPHAGRWVNPWPVGRIENVLQSAGYDTTVTPCWRGTPFSNVLLIARRRLPR
ncbi:MAG TPA: class I SAM-dependent methyltransferase [Acetobacteraceae bacterium]|nr:class I SAM-dependent methyltransferase [Acetobacteraceae bacterium]